MNKKPVFYLSMVAILVLVFLMIRSSFNQPGIEDMRAGFKEVAKYRNANNTGPVQRIYIVTVKDSIWKELEDYGNLMPHTKYGNTKVYFFMAGAEVPQSLIPGEVNFDPKFNSYCIARYEKSAMSQVTFRKGTM